MTMSNYPSGFTSGVTVRGMPLQMVHPGKIFWVNNSTVLPDGGIKGSDGNDGTYHRPFATLNKAVQACKNRRGDIILIMPGHAETWLDSTDLILNKEGVALIGLGQGSLRPTITMGGTGVNLQVGAPNISIINMKFIPGVDAVASCIEVLVNNTDCTIEGCEILYNGTNEFLTTIIIRGDAHRANIRKNIIRMGINNSASSAINITSTSEGTVIEKNKIWGDFSVANIRALTTDLIEVYIRENSLVNGVGGDINTEPCIELNAASTGVIENNNLVCNLATKAASIVAGNCLLFNNYYNEDVGSGATGGLIGTPSADD